MATKIGFKAQPLIDSGGVDWLSVGRDVVKTLTDQEKAREETRQKGEQAYRDEIKRLGSVELGKDALANQWIMNTVDSITGTAGIDQKLWKSGALSTKDYLRNKANRKNGTDLVLQSYNTYNKNYNEVMDGIANGTLAKEKMLFLRAQAESMFDFEKTGVIVNPETSEVSVAKKDLVDGVYVMSENPNEFLNASELLQASSALYTAFDADKAASDLAKDVAQTVLRNMGGTDIEQAYKALYNAPKGTQEKLNQARKDQIRAILNSEDAGAFLTDYLNEGFSFTKDSDEAATKNGEMSKMILLNQDGSTSLTEEQLNYAVDKFDGILEAYLPKKQKAPLPKKKTQSEINYANQVRTFSDYGKTILDIITSTDEKDISAGLGIFKEFGIDIRRGKKFKDRIEFEMFNPRTKEYEKETVQFVENDPRGTVERMLKKTLGRTSKIDIGKILDTMGVDVFKDAVISSTEGMYSPEEIKEVLEIDSPENVMQHPITPYMPNGDANMVTTDSMIKLVENDEYEEEDLPKYIKGILVQQGLDDDIMIEIGEAGKTIGFLGRLQGATPDERFAVIKKNNKEIERINLTDIEKDFRDEIERITKQSQREGTFYEGDDSISEKQYANFQEYKVDFPEGTLAEFKIYKESQN
jgi:hypothetical protein